MKKTFHTNRGTYSFDPAHYGKMAQIFGRGDVQQDEDVTILEKFITNDSIVADIGANIGTFTIPLSKKVKEVLAFEPMPENVQWLEQNIQDNDVKNVTVFPIALGDKIGEAKMVSHTTNEYTNFSMREGKGTQVKTLDSIHRRVDVMKIDVEGCEPAVLRGAKETINQYHPTILFEVSLTDLRMHNGACPFSALDRALCGYDIYLPVESGTKLCRVFSIAFASFLEGPKAFVLRDRMLVLNLVATTGIPPVPTISNPTLYLITRFVRRMSKKIFG